MVGCCGGVQGLAAENAAGAGRGVASGRGEHRCPRGTEGTHPGRCSCVRNAETPSGSGPLAGKPTVRRAQFPGGNRMTEKRMPVAERQQETDAMVQPLQLVVVG